MSDAEQKGGPGQPQAASPAATAGVLDLLGLLAYASLTAFFRLCDDAALAISLSDKTALAEMAVAEFGHFQLLRTRIEEMAADPKVVMQPFVAAVDAFHARTAPATGWRAWSRLTSVTASPPTSTRPWPSCWSLLLVTWY